MNRGTLGIWSLALLTFVVGDVTTTHIGLNTPGVIEANPSLVTFIDRYGTPGMIFMKVSLMLTAGVWWLALGERTTRYGIPIGLSIVGITVTTWNLYILWFAF